MNAVEGEAPKGGSAGAAAGAPWEKRVEQIFVEVVGMEAGARARRLGELCAGDDALRAEVESLLGHHAPGGRFLESSDFPALAAMLPTGLGHADDLDVALPAGKRIGSYTIVSQLGAGGMGVVYVAEQERPRRTVALKLIRRGMALPGLMRRFEHEAEVLGRLQHPGIAQIYEAGTADWGYGPQPFLAMELVRGLPLTEHVRVRRLGVRERLELIATVCEAVQHAHQRGVIHRDLKPANVLADEQGRPKVLDFGVARLSDRGGQATRHTGAGQLIGTLSYMSPEQVLGAPGEVDTRTDVYALGVMLFELLTGRLPHELSEVPLPEAVRIIRDVTPVRVSSADRTLRGDVDTIAARALEKDKARRYQSAADLGADVRRFLAGEAIEARRDSALYVLRKQIARHRVLAATVAGFVLVLVALVAILFVQSERNAALAEGYRQAGVEAEAALDHARREQARADRELSVSKVERGRLLLAGGNTAVAESLLWREYLEHPGEAYVRWALWEFYSSVPRLRSRWHDSSSSSAADATPDGLRIAITSGPDEITVWRGDLSERLARIRPVPRDTGVLVISPDGRLLAGGQKDGEIIIWDATSGTEVTRLNGHTGMITGAEFISGGKGFVSASRDGTLRFWDLAGGTPPAVVPAHVSGVLAMAASQRGDLLATSGGDGMIRLWDPATASVRATVDAPSTAALGFTPDGSRLLSSDSENDVWVRDSATGAVLAHWPLMLDKNHRVFSFSFNHDGSRLVTSGTDISVYEFPSGRVLQRLLADRANSFTVRFLAGSDNILVKSGSQVSIFEPSPRCAERRLPIPARRSYCIAFSPDGRILAAGATGSVVLWEVGTGFKLGELRSNVGETRAIDFHPDGTLLAVTGSTGALRVFDLQTGAVVYTTQAHRSAAAIACRWSPDGQRLATSGFDRAVRLWDLYHTRPLAAVEGFVESCWDVAFTPDGSSLLIAPSRAELRVLDAFSLAPGRDVLAHPAGMAVTYSADGSKILTATQGRHGEIIDAATFQTLHTLNGHRHVILGVSFSPDGTMAATASVDQTVRLWEVATGLCLATLPASSAGEVSRAVFSPDGTWLATASDEPSIGLWDLTYYNRHIAENTQSRAEALGPELAMPIEAGALVKSAGEVLRQPWPRQGTPVAPVPGKPGVDPRVIEEWGWASQAAPEQPGR